MTGNDEQSSVAQSAVAEGSGSLAINAAAYASVTVYQYVTRDGADVSARVSSDPSICPYPGLETFRVSEAKFFAGRNGDIEALEQKLAKHNVCGVIAASGAGKSSLVHAGLIPALAGREFEAWDIFAFKPGQRPLYELARSLSGVLATGNDLDAQRREIKSYALSLQDEPGVLSEYLEVIAQRGIATAGGKQHNVLIFVDQWEELYTHEIDKERDILARELLDVAERGLAKVLVTMRIDFMKELLLLSTDFFRRLKPSIHYVEPMSEIGIRSAIERPAEEVGLGVPEALTSRLIADLGQGRDHGSLPYLQFVLRQLWQNRDRAGNSLTVEAYDGMNGLAGAIGAHADAVFFKLSDNERTLAQTVLPRLANISESGSTTSRRLPFADFGTQARDLLRKLAEPDKRLVVLSAATTNVTEAEVVAEVAHEALLADWKTLSGWIAERQEFFRLRNRLEADAKEWENSRRRFAYLNLRGLLRKKYKSFNTKSASHDFSYTALSYIKANRVRDWAVRVSLIAVSMLFVILTTVYLSILGRERDEKTELQIISLLSEAEALLELGDVDASLQVLLAAADLSDITDTRDDMRMRIALFNSIRQAKRQTQFAIPTDLQFFNVENSIWYFDLEGETLFRVQADGSPIVVGQFAGVPLDLVRQVDGGGLLLLLRNQSMIEVYDVETMGLSYSIRQFRQSNEDHEAFLTSNGLLIEFEDPKEVKPYWTRVTNIYSGISHDQLISYEYVLEGLQVGQQQDGELFILGFDGAELLTGAPENELTRDSQLAEFCNSRRFRFGKDGNAITDRLRRLSVEVIRSTNEIYSNSDQVDVFCGDKVVNLGVSYLIAEYLAGGWSGDEYEDGLVGIASQFTNQNYDGVDIFIDPFSDNYLIVGFDEDWLTVARRSYGGPATQELRLGARISAVAALSQTRVAVLLEPFDGQPERSRELVVIDLRQDGYSVSPEMGPPIYIAPSASQFAEREVFETTSGSFYFEDVGDWSRLVNADGGEQYLEFPFAGPWYRHVRVAPDGTRFAYSSDEAIFLRDTLENKSHSIPIAYLADRFTFLGQGSDLIFLETNGRLMRWDFTNPDGSQLRFIAGNVPGGRGSLESNISGSMVLTGDSLVDIDQRTVYERIPVLGDDFWFSSFAPDGSIYIQFEGSDGNLGSNVLARLTFPSIGVAVSDARLEVSSHCGAGALPSSGSIIDGSFCSAGLIAGN